VRIREHTCAYVSIRDTYSRSASVEASSRATCSALLCAIFQSNRQRRDCREGGRRGGHALRRGGAGGDGGGGGSAEKKRVRGRYESGQRGKMPYEALRGLKLLVEEAVEALRKSGFVNYFGL
jgi:hypothetical protein